MKIHVNNNDAGLVCRPHCSSLVRKKEIQD